MIFVKIQMGLLQEVLLAKRVKGDIFAYIMPCQSGYQKGVESPHFVLHEVAAMAKVQGRQLWLVLGDFKKAFPRVWRNHLLLLLNKGPRVLDGAFALLASILESDVAHVWLGGRSSVVVVEGIPEGGSLGPLTYNLLPDTLVRRLVDGGHGFGIVSSVPLAWKGRHWSGQGTPVDTTVAVIRSVLRGGGNLPSSELLGANPDLEASALRAMDLEATVRVPCLFHADDPVFMASSRGALQATLDIVSSWAKEVGASFHVGRKKTVSMVTGCLHACSPTPLAFDNTELSAVSVHRWLGPLWPADLDFSPLLHQRMQVATAALSQLAGFAASYALPWELVGELFETKVDSLLEFCRWLFILAPGAEQVINGYYEQWSRILLGADFWRNPAPCMCSIGWSMSGYHRVVLSVAIRRAKLWLTCASDYHASFFRFSGDAPCSWARISQNLLEQCGILDWPHWHGEPRSLESYRAYVLGVLRGSFQAWWCSTVRKHCSTPPYYDLEVKAGASTTLWRGVSLPSAAHFGIRCWCRLRCGLLDLAHLGGRRSAAIHRECIFCRQATRTPLVHCISVCKQWDVQRQAMERHTNSRANEGAFNFTKACLSSTLPSSAAECMVAWSVEIGAGEHDFWNSSR